MPSPRNNRGNNVDKLQYLCTADPVYFDRMGRTHSFILLFSTEILLFSTEIHRIRFFFFFFNQKC